MTNQQEPVALRLAEELEHDPGINRPSVVAELRRLHAENTALQQGYDAARMEIEGLRDRVQELGAMLRENRCKRIVELEAQLEAIGAGGVEPLRRRECLHQIAEPAPIARNAAERDALLQAAIDFNAITMEYSQAAPADPLDTPLPCDLTAGGVTIGKGCPLRTVQLRLQVQADANALLLLRAKEATTTQAAPAAVQCVECNSCGSAFDIDTYMAGYTDGKGHCLNCPGIDHDATQPAPAAQVDALPWLQANDMAALERFAETTDDDESYDIGKEAVQRLAGFGCLRSHGFGKYSITDFGHYVLNDWSLARELPFKSQSERDAARSQVKEGGA